MVLDGVPYLRASVVTVRQVRDDLALVRLLAYSPELNPVEECWRQLTDALSNRYRFFDSLEQLNSAIDAALDRISVPNMSNYF